LESYFSSHVFTLRTTESNDLRAIFRGGFGWSKRLFQDNAILERSTTDWVESIPQALEVLS